MNNPCLNCDGNKDPECNCLDLEDYNNYLAKKQAKKSSKKGEWKRFRINSDKVDNDLLPMSMRRAYIASRKENG